jgi:serine/threonine protein kinase
LGKAGNAAIIESSDQLRMPDAFIGGDRFEITRRIGAGGMGVVYEAFDREQRTRVALKTLRYADASLLYRFKQEFRNLTGVVHPNLATLYELFAVNDSWFFTMELVDGCNFLDYVRRGPGQPLVQNPTLSGEVDVTLSFHRDAEVRLPVRPPQPLASAEQFLRLRRVMRQLAEAINTLHGAGKLHRDIKPSNVLVTNEGRTVLLDFGLTIALNDEVDKHVISGTVEYMSPEQAEAMPLGPASDWYAVGCMLYESLTGRLPFRGSDAEVLSEKRSMDVHPPHHIAPNAPADLDRLCSDLLRRDPARRPVNEEILRRLGVRSAITLASDRVSLVGRREHLDALHAAFHSVCEGRPVAVFLHGGSGEGKSFLVESFIGSVPAHEGAVVLAGRCYDTEAVPYKALDSLIDSLSRYLKRNPEIVERIVPRDARALTRVFPVLQNVPALLAAPQRSLEHASDQEVRRRAAAALRELLARLGDRVPVVLCIDDLQWGDADSGVILSELLRGPDPPVALFIGVYRTESSAVSPILRLLLGMVSDTGGMERRDLPVGVLSRSEARSLAEQLLEDFGDARNAAEAIADESAGVPYFIHELVRFVRSGEQIRLGTPITLEEMLERRVAALPAPSRALLETIALAGRPIQQGDAIRAAEVTGDVSAAVARLRSEHLLRSSGPGEKDTVEPYHDRIRETLVSRMTAQDRKERHRLLAETLESSRVTDPETLALHFRGAERFDRAAHYYAEAARQAADALAFDHAAELDRQSLLLRAANDPANHALRVHLADALANAGRGGEAAAEYQRAFDDADPFEAVELRRRAAYHYAISGHIAEGRDLSRALLAQHGMKMPETPASIIAALLLSRLRLWLRGYKFRERAEREIDPAQLSRIDVVWSVALGLSMTDLIGGAALQTRGLILALDSGEPYRVARSMTVSAAQAANEGRKSAAKMFAVAEDIVVRCRHPHLFALLALTRGAAEFVTGRWSACLPLVDEADVILRERCTGMAWELDTAHTFALWSLIYMGEFAELTRRTALLLKEAEDRGDRYAYTNFGTYHQPHALLAADDPRAARELFEASRARWTTDRFYMQNLTCVFMESLIDTYEGDGTAGYQRYEKAWPALKSSQMLRSQLLRLLTYHFRARAALAAAARGNRPDLLRAAEADAKRIAAERVAWSVPYARVLFAGVALLRGDRDRAVSLLRQSADEFDRADMRSHSASARLLLGELLGGADGEQLMKEANDWFAAHGVRNGRAMARMHIGAVV